MKTYVILHNIRSAHNVGSIMRTADGAGVHTIYMTGYTPAPVDRFGRVNKEIQKTSLGASESVPYESGEDIEGLIKALKAKGVRIIAVEQTEDAVPYTQSKEDGNRAFIFGNEVTGIEPEVLQLADAHIHVPMKGMKESLNVSVCAGIVLFNSK